MRGSPRHELSDAFDGTIDCGIRVTANRSRTCDARRLQSHRDGAEHVVARAVAINSLKLDASAPNGLRMLRERRKQSVLGVGARLRARRIVYSDNLDVHILE